MPNFRVSAQDQDQIIPKGITLSPRVALFPLPEIRMVLGFVGDCQEVGEVDNGKTSRAAGRKQLQSLL